MKNKTEKIQIDAGVKIFKTRFFRSGANLLAPFPVLVHKNSHATPDEIYSALLEVARSVCREFSSAGEDVPEVIALTGGNVRLRQCVNIGVVFRVKNNRLVEPDYGLAVNGIQRQMNRIWN